MSAGMQKEPQAVLAPLAVKREVARVSDGYFEAAREHGERLSRAGLGRSQVLNLEKLASTGDRLADIYDFLKRQMGKTRDLGNKWRRGGEELLQALVALETDAQRIVQRVRDRFSQGVDDDTVRRVHLLLCREYLKHVTAHYLYSAAGDSR